MLGDISPSSLRLITNGVTYPGRDHVDQIVVTRWDGTRYKGVDLSALTGIELTLLGSDPLIVFTAAGNPGTLWAEGSSLYVDLSSFNLGGASYETTVVVYDAEHLRGQVMIDNRDAKYEVRSRQVGVTAALPPPLVEWVHEAPTDGKSYLRVNGQWVEYVPADTGIDDAPADGKSYLRVNGQWVEYVPADTGIDDAPADGKSYLRVNGQWVEYVPADTGIADAPADGKSYLRVNGQWVEYVPADSQEVLAAIADLNERVLALESATPTPSPLQMVNEFGEVLTDGAGTPLLIGA